MAIFVIYYTNFFTVIITNEKIDQFYFYFSILNYSSTLIIFIYLSYYLSYFKKINDDQWETYAPNAIPTASIMGILGMIR